MWRHWLVTEDSLRNETMRRYIPGSLSYVESMSITVVCRLCTNTVWPKYIFNLDVRNLNMKREQTRGNGQFGKLQFEMSMSQLVGGNWTKQDKQKYEYKDPVCFDILALHPPKFPGIFLHSKLILLWNKKLPLFHCSFWHFYSRRDRGGVWESAPQRLLWSISFLQSRLSFFNFSVSTCLLHLSPSGCWRLFSKDGCFAVFPNSFLHKEPRNSLNLIISPLVLYFCSISKSDFCKMQ